MRRTAKRQLLLAAAIVVYWLIYFLQEHLADLGDYRFFSYRFHEIYPIGGLLLPLAVTIWLVAVLVRTAREKDWRKNAVLLAVLLALTVGQAAIIRYERQSITVLTRAEVLEIPDDYHIIISHEGKTVTLNTSPLVPPLLKTDGTLYWFDYGTNRLHPARGILHRVSP